MTKDPSRFNPKIHFLSKFLIKSPSFGITVGLEKVFWAI
jgi:hypothetical protein